MFSTVVIDFQKIKWSEIKIVIIFNFTVDFLNKCKLKYQNGGAHKQLFSTKRENSITNKGNSKLFFKATLPYILM